MKQIFTILFIGLINTTVLAQESIITALLERLDNLPSTNKSFNMVLEESFSIEEQVLLNNYFEEQAQLVSSTTEFSRDPVLDFFYVLNSRNEEIFGRLDAEPPFNSVDPILTIFDDLFADDFDNTGTLYALDHDLESLVTVSVTNGEKTVIGPLLNFPAGQTIAGLSYNVSNDTMYAISTNGVDETILYTVDLTSGEATLIGSLGISIGIWLEIDNEGNAFSAEVVTNAIYSVDLETGQATIIGVPFDVDINFAQEATFDHVHNVLYMAAYTGGGTGGIYIVDRDTGEIELVGDTSSLNAEFVMFSAHDETLSVKDNIKPSFSVFPNPSSDWVTLETNNIQEIIAVEIYNVLGQRVNISMSGKVLDISNLNNGLYIVNVITANGSSTQKIIKK